MKQIISFFAATTILFCIVMPTHASDNEIKANNHLFGTCSGGLWGLQAGLNYERVIFNTNLHQVSAQISGGGWYMLFGGGGYYSLAGSYALGNNHKMELTLGAINYIGEIGFDPLNEDSEIQLWLPKAGIGYCFKKPENRCMFKIKVGFPEYVSLSFGFVF